MHLNKPIPSQDALRSIITKHYHCGETDCVNQLLTELGFNAELESQIDTLARQLITTVRKKEASKKGVEALMVHYDLSTQEGIMLMCLAEALLRIPDKETEHLLIRDKLTSAQWGEHLGKAESSFVNMATWGLALTGKILNKDPDANSFKKLWQKMLRTSSEPVVRRAVREAIKIMSEQFVLGRKIEEALKRSKESIDKGYSFSYDMLGEAARTMKDADAYLKAYTDSISAIGKTVDPNAPLFHQPNISVKLSAIYPRYDFLHQTAARTTLIKRLKKLSLLAKSVGICLTVDAEEADRLDLSL
ncbi:MAG: bifunctional proline dehydrogenase/L-glutamate gamma-semialdehyde dehydrogenase, partial [Coxiella sp. (in: Bacteria)]